MAIAFRSAATAANGAAPASLVVAKPAGTVDGDVLVAFVVVSADQTITTVPAGWTTVGSQSTGTAAGDCRHAVYRKVASSEPSSWTWGWSSGADCAIVAAAYSGVSTSAPINTSASRLMAGSTTSHVAPSVTPNQASTVTLSAFGTNPFFDGNTTFSTPSGLTVRGEADPGAGTTNRAVLKVFDKSTPTAAATGDKTSTLNNSAKGVGWTVTLGPSGATAQVIIVESRES